MQQYKDYRPTGFDAKGAFLRDDRQEWLVLPVIQTRDSGPLDRSNFDSALKALGGESETVQVHRFGHWGPGWLEIIIVQPDSPQAKLAEEIESSLADYPVLDEQHYSKLECEEYQESWDSWGQSAYVKELKKRLRLELTDPEDIEEYVDCLEDIESEQIDKLVEPARRFVNWEYQSDDSGVSINIQGLADATDIDSIVAMLSEVILQKRKEQDITKLAKACGLNDEQTKQAIAQGLTLRSQIESLKA